MRVVVELLGAILVLIVFYYGGKELLTRWVKGPRKETKEDV